VEGLPAHACPKETVVTTLRGDFTTKVELEKTWVTRPGPHVFFTLFTGVGDCEPAMSPGDSFDFDETGRFVPGR
jgi:hypothetical protein